MQLFLKSSNFNKIITISPSISQLNILNIINKKYNCQQVLNSNINLYSNLNLNLNLDQLYYNLGNVNKDLITENINSIEFNKKTELARKKRNKRKYGTKISLRYRGKN